VNSTADYYSPVWCRSSHTRLIDPAINDALRIVTGCLRPKPADNLPILAGIPPVELRRNGATLSLARRAMEPGHLLHSALVCPSSANARCLKSSHPFVPAAQLISLSDKNNIRDADHQWNAEWSDNPTSLRIFILDTGSPAPTHAEWPSQEEPGTGITASALVSDGPAPACTNGVWPVLRPFECGAEE